MTLYNHLGQEELLQTFTIDYPQHVKIDISEFTNGIYTIALQSLNKKIRASKIVVSKLD